uniref:UMOD/GP2/OIT3-like D8C domain-containing protein n=1 Tax=Esox lucius TaxID=8010 RepID=A0AAY5L7P4_ESOLU
MISLSPVADSSVLFSCGAQQCPAGQDCSSANTCYDPCQSYTSLNDSWRSTNNTDQSNLHCDQNLQWQGWYRMFLEGTSVRMPDYCVPIQRCGTHAPMWIDGTHPSIQDKVVQRGVCGSWTSGCCTFRSNPIHIKACPGNYYVYKFVTSNNCFLAYCAGNSFPSTHL